MTGVNIATFVLILMVLVLVHEAGHMVVAKWCGMRVERFSIFFGRSLFSFRRGETDYAIGWLPLGGYVRITGMSRDEMLPPEVEPRAYYAQKTWKKVATILAGPAVNVLLGFLMFATVAWIGPSTQVVVNRVAEVQTGTPAAEIGLQPGDRLVAVNAVRVQGDEVEAARRELQSHPGEVVTVVFERGGQVVQRQVRLDTATQGGRKVGRLGLNFDARAGPRESHGFIGGITRAWDVTVTFVAENGKAIGRLFTDEKARDDVSSVVGIGAAYNEVAQEGVIDVLIFIGAISLVLGLFNLLPFLPLDGGHILFAFIEKLRGSPLSRVAYQRFSFIGLALIMVVFVFALQNDIGRISGDGFDINR